MPKFESVEILPTDSYVVDSAIEFYRLKEGKRSLSLKTIEIPAGIDFYLYSLKQERYYHRVTTLNHDFGDFKELFNSGRVYISLTEESSLELIRILKHSKLDYRDTFEYCKALFYQKHYLEVRHRGPEVVTKHESVTRYIQHLENKMKL